MGKERKKNNGTYKKRDTKSDNKKITKERTKAKKEEKIIDVEEIEDGMPKDMKELIT